MKLGIYNYFPDITTHANPYGAAVTWVPVSGLVSFRVFCFFIMRTGRTVGQIFAVYTLRDVFSAKDVPFNVSLISLPTYGVKSQEKLPKAV